MSDIVLYDAFNGSGDLEGRKPDICFDAATAWEVGPYSSYKFDGVSGGYLFANSSAGIGGSAAIAELFPPYNDPANRFAAEIEFTLPAGFAYATDMSVDLAVWSATDDIIVTGFIRYSDYFLQYQMEVSASDSDYGEVLFPASELVAGGTYTLRIERNEAAIVASVGARSVSMPAPPQPTLTSFYVDFGIGKNFKSGYVSLSTGFEPDLSDDPDDPGVPSESRMKLNFEFPVMDLLFTVLVEPVFPMMQLDAYLGFGVDFGFPVMTGEYVLASAIEFTFPMMTLDAGFVKHASVDFDFPLMCLDASFGASSDWAFPALRLDAKLTNAEGKNALDFDFPMMTFEGQMGGQVGFDFPMMTIEADMTQTALIQVDFTFPAMTLDAALSGEPYKLSVDFLLPMLQVEAQFGEGAEFNLPMMTIDAHLQSGGLLSLDFAIPMMTLDAELTQQNHGAIEFTFPMMVPVHGITADFTIPMMQLDAHIKAVVSVTYEAYSVNLTHTSESPTDEVTRYTNYPFDQIVRLGGDYYGVATDGLYLLGGKLDGTAPIAYSVKTCIDDFKVKEFKNIASGYFGGRIGPDMKVTVYAGEQGEESYDYSTPRGQGAQNHREKFGRGVKNRYYAIGVSGEEELELDNIELEINKMTRRI